MPAGMSDPLLIPTGIPQGSLISPILYLIYNANLIEVCGNGLTSNKLADDVCFIGKGHSECATLKTLRLACQKGATPHASVCDPKKFAPVNLMNTRAVDPKYTALSHQGHTVAAIGTSER
jgi:hypothetical protein